MQLRVTATLVTFVNPLLGVRASYGTTSLKTADSSLKGNFRCCSINLTNVLHHPTLRVLCKVCIGSIEPSSKLHAVNSLQRYGCFHLSSG
jgi:hypothetical protein